MGGRPVKIVHPEFQIPSLYLLRVCKQSKEVYIEVRDCLRGRV